MTATVASGSGTEQTTSFGDALAMAQEDAMREDSRVILLGQDIQAGFPFGATKGLVDIFGVARVINTPISEAGTMGCAVGAALGGLKPVVEVDFAGFLLLGLDQLVNNGAKLRYMSGNQVSVPLVVRIGQGPLGSFAAQHSQTQYAYLSGIPGLTTLAPATPRAPTRRFVGPSDRITRSSCSRTCGSTARPVPSNVVLGRNQSPRRGTAKARMSPL